MVGLEVGVLFLFEINVYLHGDEEYSKYFRIELKKRGENVATLLILWQMFTFVLKSLAFCPTAKQNMVSYSHLGL